MNNHSTSNRPEEPHETLLIIDDTPANLRLLTQMLGKAGYQIRATLNSQRGLENAQAMPPDLIILDIKMPEMDGYETCQRLKADSRTRHVPVIFISAFNEPEEKAQAFTSGGVDYIVKPFQVEEVLGRVRTHLALQRTRQELQSYKQELAAFTAAVEALKRPLSHLVGQQPPTPPESITGMGHHILGLMDDLTLLAGVRRQQIEPVPLDMGHIVTAVRERLAPITEEFGAEFTLPDRWPVALGDARWIETAWEYYLVYAISQGGQPPRLALGAAGQADGFIRFWVRDNGPPLSTEEQANLLQPFEQREQLTIGPYGLGLSLIRRIVEKMGGEVGLESDQGRTFYFTLPAAG